MPGPDLQSPLADFLQRTAELKRIVALVEEQAKGPDILNTRRVGIDLAQIGLVSTNTVNAMALVFLASSFEEFVREEMKQCSSEIALKYVGLPAGLKGQIRNSYWSVSLERMKFVRSILTQQKPKTVDLASITKLKGLVEAAGGFVVNDDPTFVDGVTLAHHSHNLKPRVVDELSSRIGVTSLIDSASEHAPLKAYFGTQTKADTASRLRGKLDEFCDRRNEIVHSLSAVAGYGVATVLDYIEFFEALTESIKRALAKVAASW